MGKAGKWVMNFLLGKKQGGNNNNTNKVSSSKTDSNCGGSSFQEGCSVETAASVVGVALPPQTPTHHHKRRWSFGKSSSKDKSSSQGHTTTTNPLLQASSPADHIEQLLLGPSLLNNEAVTLAISEAIKIYERKSNPSQAAAAAAAAKTDGPLRIVSFEHLAATRIQAAFRSYLARRALAALKALVKLQALARGHLVRKYMSATIRKMHAVMSIQVRARFQRIQMSDHSLLQEGEVVDQSSKLGASPPRKKRIKRAQSGLILKNNYSKDGDLNDSQKIRTRSHSGDLSFLKRERPYEESSYSSTHTSPGATRHYRASQQVVSGRAGFVPVEPSYMAKTESSRARSRSLSEPKQRPRRSISSNTRRSPSSDGTNSVQSEVSRPGFSLSASQSKRIPIGEFQDQWFIKLYRSTVAPPWQGGDDYYRDCDREILVACEPHLNMY